MSTITKQILHGLDDAYKSGASSINTSGFISFGNAGGVIRNLGIRFRSIPIPKGSTITSAYIKLKANANLSGTTCNGRIRAEDNSNPAAFSDYTDFAGRTLTSTYVDWNSVGAFTTDTEYTSPDIGSVIQAIVNRADWAKNKNIALFIHDNSSSTDARRAAYGFEDSSTNCAKLEITYTLGTSYVIRVSLPGYDCLTDTDPDHFALYSDEDWVLIKEKTRGSSSISNGGSSTVAHGLSYIPYVLVFAEVSTGKWAMVVGDSSDYNCHIELNTTNLVIYNNLGATKTFKYYIFYDQQV